MEPFATVDDLASRWRELGPDEEARAAVLLEDASVQLAAALGSRLDADDGGQRSALRMVACSMVRRCMSAGEDAAGVTNFSQGAGGYTASVTYANPNGDMFLTAAEQRMLGIGAGRIGFASLSGGGGR